MESVGSDYITPLMVEEEERTYDGRNSVNKFRRDFVTSLPYKVKSGVDPENPSYIDLSKSKDFLSVETDLQAGTNHRYELLWVILIGLIFALINQSLAANLGVTTGRR